MSLKTGKLVSGAAWTLGGFGVSQVIRLGTSVALARLLAPEMFGTMLIVNTLMTGIQLFSDVGIGQNIVHSPRALEPSFYNTAWSLQIIRSLVIWFDHSHSCHSRGSFLRCTHPFRHSARVGIQYGLVGA